MEEALIGGHPCLAEAGTGVGKTLAYLVPIFRWLDRHGGRAVISTHTLALQAQLIERDIPALLAALPELDIRAGVLKGRSNFLCLQELEGASSELWNAGDPLFRQIQRWSNETDTGDASELDFSFPGWSEVAANADTCRQRECRFYDRCFYFKARKFAEECNLLVVNHSLFFADLRLKRSNPNGPTLIPPYDAVVFDEAHHVEDMGTRAFGVEWGSRRVPQLTARARKLPGIDTDRLSVMEQLNEHLMAPLSRAPKSEAFLDEAFTSSSDRSVFFQIRDDLCSHLNLLARDLTKSADNADTPAARDKANGMARIASRLSTELFQVTMPDRAAPPATTDTDEEATPEDSVPTFRWFNTRRMRTGQAHSTLVRTPLQIASLMEESLLAETPRAVFVSATLASGGNFTYLKQRLGLQGEVSPPIEIIEGSPFDYRNNCLLYIPRSLGGPAGGYGNADGGEGYADRLAAEVLSLVEAARGRTFALFTSHRMLTAVRDRLWDRCDYPLFTQGEMPNGRLVEAFVASGEGVLLGTSSFWEGVDVPGPALSCVIMDKLPFAAPDSPLQRAREDAARSTGGDAFRQISIPQAQIRLKQGFGRLLRTADDRGVVAILDGRLWTKGYGRELLADLPPCPRTSDLTDVQHFFAEEAVPSRTQEAASLVTVPHK